MYLAADVVTNEAHGTLIGAALKAIGQQSSFSPAVPAETMIMGIYWIRAVISPNMQAEGRLFLRAGSP